MNSPQRILIVSLLIAIVSCSMSFFGFVYEEIDFVPNYFSLTPIDSKMHWNNFHSITNPAHYHIPASLISISSIIVVWFYKKYLTGKQIIKLKAVTMLLVLINIITGIAVTWLNGKLFFDSPIENSRTIVNLAVIWAILNFVRLCLTALCIIMLAKMFSFNLETKK